MDIQLFSLLNFIHIQIKVYFLHASYAKIVEVILRIFLNRMRSILLTMLGILSTYQSTQLKIKQS